MFDGKMYHGVWENPVFRSDAKTPASTILYHLEPDSVWKALQDPDACDSWLDNWYLDGAVMYRKYYFAVLQQINLPYCRCEELLAHAKEEPQGFEGQCLLFIADNA